jgi:hypothetical protein
VPSGIPQWVKAPEVSDLDEWLRDKCGFARVDVDCPQDLVHPVLPETIDGRLNFTLEPKRGVVFTIVELNRAVDCGYRVLRVHEALLFTPRSDMFKSYIATHLRGKLEASGELTPEQHAEKSEICRARYGFELGECSDNPGARGVSKLFLNSLWGKFAQRVELPRFEYVNPKQWYSLLTRQRKGELELKYECPIGNDTMFVQYVDRSARNMTTYKTNLAMAAYVTACGRIRLHRAMHALGLQLLYNDTDSVYYAEPPGSECPLEVGDLLGQWSDDFSGMAKGGGDLICTGLVSTGAKSYGLRFANEGEGVKLKLKGVTLSHTNLESVSYDSMRALVVDQSAVLTGLQGQAIRRAKNPATGGATLHSCAVTKSLRATHTKTVPVEEEFAGEYLPGYLLPRGHVHSGRVHGKRKTVGSDETLTKRAKK